MTDTEKVKNKGRFDFGQNSCPGLIWKARICSSYRGFQPLIFNNKIYTLDQEEKFIILDIATGLKTSPTKIFDNLILKPYQINKESIYFFAKNENEQEQYLCAYNVNNDNIIWFKNIHTSGKVSIITDEHILTIREDNKLYSIKLKSGAIKWTHKLRPLNFHDFTLNMYNNILLVTGTGKAGFDKNGYILALDKNSGNVEWIYATGGEVWNKPVAGESKIYIGDQGNRFSDVYCLSASPNARTGECLWRYKLEGLPLNGAISAGILYWGSYEGYLYAFDSNSGDVLWRFSTCKKAAYHGPPCVAGDWVFVGVTDGYLYGLDAQSGNLRWKYFVIDEEAIQAERLKKAREQGKAETTHTEIPENNELKELQDDIDLFTWAAAERLFLLTNQGFLFCFKL